MWASPGWVCVSKLKPSPLGCKNYFLGTFPLTYYPSLIQRKQWNKQQELLRPWQCHTAHCSEPMCRGTLSTTDSDSLRPFHHLWQPWPSAKTEESSTLSPNGHLPSTTGQKTECKLAIWKWSEVWTCLNLTRSMITKREAFESARPAPQHQLIINLVFPVMWMHVYFTKSHFKIAIQPLPHTTPWHNLGKVLFAWPVLFTTTN